MVTGGSDSSLYVWNIANSPPTNPVTFSSHTDVVLAVDILTSGYLVSGGNDMDLYVWSATLGSTYSSKISAHTGNILCIKALTNGYFATGSQDNTIKIWNPNSMSSPVKTLTPHTRNVNSLDQLSNGYLMSGSNDGYTILWDSTDWSQKNTFVSVNSQKVTCVREITSGVVVAAGTDSSIYVWRIDSASSQMLIETVVDAINGETPCWDMLVYNKSLLVVATSSVNTEVFDVHDPYNVTYVTTLTVPSGNSYGLASLGNAYFLIIFIECIFDYYAYYAYCFILIISC